MKVLPVTVALAAALALTACGSDDSGSDTAGSSSGKSSGTEVVIKTFQFAPKDLKVKAGTKVTWKNDDAILHTVTLGKRGADDMGQPTDVEKSGELDLQLEKGQSGSYTFDKAGTYTYFCDRHPGMDATVTVTS